VANQTVRAIDPDCEATMILTPLDNMNRSENIFFATLSSTVRSNLAFSQIKLRDTEEKLTPGPAILYFATAFPVVLQIGWLLVGIPSGVDGK